MKAKFTSSPAWHRLAVELDKTETLVGVINPV